MKQVSQILKEFFHLDEDFILKRDMILADEFGADMMTRFELAVVFEDELLINILDKDCQRWETVGSVLRYFGE